MPSEELTDQIREAFASARKDIAYLETIEIAHPDIDTFWLVKNNEDLILTIEDSTSHLFEAVAFRMGRPKQGQDGAQELSFSVDNVDRRIGDAIDVVKYSQIETKIRWRPYLSNDLTQPQIVSPLELTIVESNASTYEVNFSARFVDVLNRKFPNEMYTRARFPSLGES